MKFIKYKKPLIAVIFAVCLILSCFFIFSSINYVSFDMNPDNDSSFYHSNEYKYGTLGLYSDNYLSFNNGELYARDFGKEKINTFTPNNNSSLSVPKDACKVNNKLFYINSGSLFCEDIESGEKNTIDSSCEYFVLDDKTIVYTKDNNIFAKTINSFETKGVIEPENEIYYFNIIDNYLYLVERLYEDNNGTIKALSKGTGYIFSKYDINNLKLIKSEVANLTNPIEHIAICRDTFYFYYNDTQTIYNVSLNNDFSVSPIQHSDINDIVSNNENVFFVSEKTESLIVRKTVECETNGVWMLNVEDGTVRKLSGKCDFCDILATKNNVYCYKTEYYLPRGMANLWVKGFSIEQIPITE